MSNIGRLFVVGGNICAGKSTVVKELGSAEFVEPSAENNKWLAKFYEDKPRYGEVMQFYIMRKRFRSVIQAFGRVLTGDDVYLDRAVWDDFVFVWKNWIDGNFSDEALASYKELRTLLIDDLQFPSAFVYLDVKPLECLRRNREQRQNECESGLTEEYLVGLETGYGIVKNEAISKGIPWIELDWNKFGKSSDIQEAVHHVPHYDSTAKWIGKVQDVAWLIAVGEKLNTLYDAARRKAEAAQPLEEKELLPLALMSEMSW